MEAAQEIAVAIGSPFNHTRYIALISEFWSGRRMKNAELDELTRLHALNIERVWAIDTGTKEAEP